MQFKLGDKVNIKQEAWKKFLNQNINHDQKNPSPQEITEIYDYDNFGIDVMLTFPYHWFKDTDLEMHEEYKEVQRVPYPEFELVGPKCKKCDGTVILTMNLETKLHFYKCWECNTPFDYSLKPSYEELEKRIEMAIEHLHSLEVEHCHRRRFNYDNAMVAEIDDEDLRAAIDILEGK